MSFLPPARVSGYPLCDLQWRPVSSPRVPRVEADSNVSEHLRKGGISEVLLRDKTQQSQPGISYAVKLDHTEGTDGHPHGAKVARLRHQVNEGEIRLPLTELDDGHMMTTLEAGILAWHAAFFGPA